MWFKDGNRIDLTLIPLEKKDTLLQIDSLTQVLLDKDGIIGDLPEPDDRDYLIKKPTEQEFLDLCNEFWWITMNTAKGLWREELSYAMFMHEQISRNVLIKVIEWDIAIRTDFQRSAGKLGKYFKEFLSADEWRQFTQTYSNSDYCNIWSALFVMCDLFRIVANRVASHFGFRYPMEDDQNVVAFLKEVQNLPK